MKTLEAQRRFSQLENAKNSYRSRDIELLLEERGEKLRSTIRRLATKRYAAVGLKRARGHGRRRGA